MCVVVCVEKEKRDLRDGATLTEAASSVRRVSEGVRSSRAAREIAVAVAATERTSGPCWSSLLRVASLLSVVAGSVELALGLGRGPRRIRRTRSTIQ